MYTALNISSRKIKILTLSGRRVKGWASADIGEGLISDGMIQNPKAVGEAINSLFKTSRAPRNNVIVSVSCTSFTYRFITLPRLNPPLVEEAILRAVKKEITLPLEELYVAWQPTVKKGDEQEYFVVGVPRNMMDTMTETLRAARVEPYLVELRGLALARAANRSDAIIVNMESSCFDIVLVKNGVPAVLHTLTPRSESATLEDNITQLTNELTKLTAYSQSEEPISPSTPLLLTGELASEAKARGLVQSQIDYRIEALVPPVDYPKNLPLDEYTCSIGIALKRTSIKPARGGAKPFSDIDVNILAGKYHKIKAKPAESKNLLPVFALVLAVVLLAPLFFLRMQAVNDNQDLETELSQVTRQLNIAQALNQAAISTEATISELTAQAAAIDTANEGITGMRGYYGSTLQTVKSALPSGAYFTSIEILEATIIVRGEADSTAAVLQYATSLEAQGIFVEVRIVQMDESAVTAPDTGEGATSPEEVTVITFEIVCTR